MLLKAEHLLSHSKLYNLLASVTAGLQLHRMKELSIGFRWSDESQMSSASHHCIRR